MFTVALFTTAKMWKQPKCPSAEDRIKKVHVYTVEYYSAITKDEVITFAATWIDLEVVMLRRLDREGDIS